MSYLIYTDLISCLLDPRLVDPGSPSMHMTHKNYCLIFGNEMDLTTMMPFRLQSSEANGKINESRPSLMQKCDKL